MSTDVEPPIKAYSGYLRRCTAEEIFLLDAGTEGEHSEARAERSDLRERPGCDADGESAGQLTEACGDPLLGTAISA